MTKWLDHSSILGKIGGYPDKYLNPISWITKGKSTKLTSTVLPEKVNSGLSTVMKPFDKVDQTINPVRKIPIVNRAANITASKPGDALAIAAGSYFSAGALAGGGAGGGAGGAGGGLAAGGGGTADVGGLATLDSGAVATEGAAPGLMAGGGGAAAGGGGAAAATAPADVGGLASADSAAVDAEGAEPGLTQGYGPAQESAPSSQYRPQQQQQRKRQQQMQISPMGGLTEDQYQAMVNQAVGQIAQSSKTVKTRGATQAAMQRGLAGAHPVDTNGVHVAAIQELNKQIEELGAKIKAARAKRAAKGASA